jgi:glutaredoxin-like protein NrdH
MEPIMDISFARHQSNFRRNFMTTTVYSLPSCAQCDMTKKFLTKQGVAFEEVNIAEDPAAHAMIQELGYTSAPVVVVSDKGDTQTWSGFRLERLQKLAYDARSAVTAAA